MRLTHKTGVRPYINLLSMDFRQTWPPCAHGDSADGRLVINSLFFCPRAFRRRRFLFAVDGEETWIAAPACFSDVQQQQIHRWHYDDRSEGRDSDDGLIGIRALGADWPVGLIAIWPTLYDGTPHKPPLASIEPQSDRFPADARLM